MTPTFRMPAGVLRCLKKHGWVLALSLIMTACQHVPEEGGLSRWRTDLGGLPQSVQRAEWRFDAKVGIRTPDLSEQANLVWQFRDQSNHLKLFGPFGAGAITIEFDDFGVQLSDHKGVRYRGDSAERLLTEIVGWPIPVDALPAWLWGRPLPHAGFRYRLDNQRRLRVMEQLGWRIEFSDFRQHTLADQQHDLPRRITASRTFSEGRVKVRLIAKQWQ